MRSMKQGERGAALIETALALPVVLIALYGVTWGIRSGVVAERAESAVRYAGVISAQQNPYHDYSLYSLYNNLGPTSNVQTASCAKPSNLFLTGGTLPVIVPGTQQTQSITPGFWQPDQPPQPFCDATPARQYFAGATRSYVLIQSVPAMNNIVSDGGFLGDKQFGSLLTTSYKFYRSPDLATLMHCANALSTVVSSSLAPAKYGTASQIAPLQTSDFNSTPLTLSTNCTTGIGTQPIPPTPVPNNFGGGATSPPTAGPGGASPTPKPSPSPTPSPATPQPSAAPSAGASAAPSAGPTGGTGGGGGGGGTPATPGPGNGSPGPAPGPTGTATGKPTSAPVTPAPTKPPATPMPTVKPTTPPTPKPLPSPTSSGPPGSIS